MKITYDLEHLPERRATSRDSEELLALKAFLAGHHRQLPHPHRVPPRPREETPAMLLWGASRRGRSGLPRNHLRHHRQGKQEARPRAYLLRLD